MKDVEIQGAGPVERESEERIGGWKRLTSQVMYENPWIQVRHEEVQRPNGSTGIYGLVQFKNQAIGVVALDDEGNIYLVKQSRYALDDWSIEIPEGGGPRNVDPLESAKRELQEETGLFARHWELILTMHLSNSVTNELAHVFLATGLMQGEQDLDDTEDIEVMKVPLTRAIEWVKNGTITDSISVAALLRVALDE